MATSLRHIATEPANLNHKVMMGSEKCASASKLKLRTRSHHLHASDSDLSVDTASLSQESQHEKSPTKLSPGPQQSTGRHIKGLKADWEILEGLREGQRCEDRPRKHEGFLNKRRKWPLKGWHKRYFVLENGMLRYSKTASDMAKGKLHGTVDVGLSVISTKVRGRRIDIDAEEFIYHLKSKSLDSFTEWVGQLRHHRLFRQHEIAFGHKDSKGNCAADDMPLQMSPVHALPPNVRSRDGTPHPVRSPSFMTHSRVATWLAESTTLDTFNKDLAATHEGVFHLGSLVEQLEELSSSAYDVSDLKVTSNTPSLKRDRKRFILKRKKNKGSASDLTSLKSQTLDIPSAVADCVLSMQHSLNVIDANASATSSFLNIEEMSPLSSSHPNLQSVENDRFTNQPDSSNLFPPTLLTQKSHEKKLREEFLLSAKQIVSNLRNMTKTIQNERERLKQALELECLTMSSQNSSVVNSLRSSLAQALQHNADLRLRLSKIHAESELSDGSGSPDPIPVHHQSVSYESSSAVSISEYFDAAEYIQHTESSSEMSFTDEEDEGSFTSDNSETGTDCTHAPSVSDCQQDLQCTMGRRTRLPVPKPEVGDFNLWSLLCRNIGKDLSKVSMPVTLNEPLNTLQRLCEELEYSDLLDKAAETDDAYERMVLVAAFAVSAYGSSYYRAGHKPFNPLLGETYESIRDDKGFRFIAEQVSHHPPVSVCHAESKNFLFWQDMRIKTTFWGKSMEVQPVGSVHLVLTKYNEHYRWNKVTMCVHNLFGGQRWVDQYGEMCISCANMKCKLTFAKATYWSNKRHEVYGNITSGGKVVCSLYGKWNEGLYCGTPPSARCIWRIGAMPEDHESYYGFTRYAIELNELEPEMVNLLPPTDTRFRPDQRLLEEGNVQGAEAMKVQLEQAQRDRKKKREEDSVQYEPLWFKKGLGSDGKECWEYNGMYWPNRKSPGFVDIHFSQQLWQS